MRRSKPRQIDEDEVLTAAVGVAFDVGLHAVDHVSVAARLGVPVKSVIAVAPDERAVVASAFSRIVSVELAEVKRFVLANPSATRQMMALLDTLAEPVRAEVDAVWLESWSLGRRNPALGAAVREEEGAWHAFVASVVRRGIKSGDFDEVDAHEVAAHILAVIDGVNAYALVGYHTDLDRLHLLHSVARTHLGSRFAGAGRPVPVTTV